ncbi:MAG: AAA domain-containing protein [Chloroflexaceae bacterium]|jgi:DNA polymerase III delta prime subunit|nr:AAA domain-containing protein [Chloroflexaceae bacterium]
MSDNYCLTLAHPLQLVPVNKLSINDQLAQRGIHINPTSAVALLNTMPQVHVVVRQEKSDTYGQQEAYYFCTPQFLLRCIVSDKEDSLALLLINIDTHEKLYRLPNWLSIAVQPTEWRFGQYHEPWIRETAPTWVTAFRERLTQDLSGYKGLLHHQAETEIQKETLDSGQQLFLERVQKLVNLNRETERRTMQQQPHVAFTSYSGTSDRRVVRPTYRFTLASRSPFSIGDRVQVGWAAADAAAVQADGAAGVVEEVQGRELVVQFFRQVDVQGKGSVGLIGPSFNDTQYKVQEQAIEDLGNGKAANPHLLNVLAHHRYQPYTAPAMPASPPTPVTSRKLNDAQQRVAWNTPYVDDLFLVQGPPGTGKTTLITQLAAELRQQGRKVLITSQNNKAVDNVLEGLKHRLPETRIVRIGNEDKITSAIKPLMLEEQARTMQERICQATEATHHELQGAARLWEELAPEMGQLYTAVRRVLQPKQAQTEARALLETQRQQLWQQFQPSLQARLEATQQAHLLAQEHSRQAHAASKALARACWQRRVLGRRRDALVQQRLQQAEEARQQAQTALEQLHDRTNEYTNACQHYQTLARSFKSIRQAKQRLHEVSAGNGYQAQPMGERVTAMHQRLAGLPLPLPALPNNDAAAVCGYLERLGLMRELLLARASLLAEWRAFLADRRLGLAATLVRNADVVGATCICIATRQLIRDLTFDVVIADEAGQIQVFNLLVPLVRGRKAILVGDHIQLPPVVDQELAKRVEDEPEAVQHLLNKSIFEVLFEPAPASHKAQLNEQHRMPATIANFIADEFYDGNYHSPSGNADPGGLPFQTSFCMIDTEQQPAYREMITSANDDQGEQAGYSNPGEAKLLARLAAFYLRQPGQPGQAYEQPLGIIVPYKKQVELVKEELRKQHIRQPEEIVATVDSFQGNERDIILFGFTRSNRGGNIGFLKELRRLNVTMTRARRQLVLLGDRETLCGARDDNFRRFAHSLWHYLQHHGRVLTVPDVEAELRKGQR